MTSNRSFFKLVREAMRRNIWAAALSLIGFFFCLPLPAVMLIQNRITSARTAGTSQSEQMQFAANDLHTLLGMDNMAVKAGICIMAVLCGIALFSYLHSRQRVDFYHSVPLGRSTLFWINYTTGLLTVLPAFYIMYALAALIGAVMGVPVDTPDSIHASEIVSTLLMHTLFFLLLYTLSALAAILTGNTILAVLLDAWILLSLPAVGLIGQTLGQQYLNHWSSSGPLEWMCAHTSPIIQYLSMGSDYARYLGTNRYDTFSSAMPTLVAVLILTLLFLGISRALFLHRKSERSGTALAFEGLKLPIKCYMVLMIAFVFGIVFQGTGGDGWIWFGLLAGTALGHILIEILYHFDLRAAFAHWKTMIVLAVAAAFAWAIYSTIGKKLGKLGLSVVATTKRTFLWGLAFMLPLLPVLGFGSGATGEGMGGLLNPVMVANLLFLGLVASATCYVMWNKSAGILGVVKASAYIYLSPIITVACSVAVLGEPLTWQIALGVALTIAGLVLSER